MKSINYTNMSDQELKQYLLEHKDDQEAFYAYLDRKQQHPKQVMIGVDELDSLTREQQIEQNRFAQSPSKSQILDGDCAKPINKGEASLFWLFLMMLLSF